MPETLAMLKMEKNFVAHLKKKYPRKPYSHYSLGFLVKRLKEEVAELEFEANINAFTKEMKKTKKQWLMRECADISNIVDFIFEKIGGEHID